jgi:hypothetical protein
MQWENDLFMKIFMNLPYSIDKFGKIGKLS